MLKDIVIDTNVLMHADNVSSGRDKEAVDLLVAMLSSNTALCLDVASGGEEYSGSSLIRQEYSERLDGGGLGTQFVTQMASEGRISYVSREVEAGIRKWINQSIGNTRDRTFVRAAINSSEKVLASHDYLDFRASVRKELWKKVQVDVLDAGEAAVRVGDGGGCEAV